LLKCWNGQLNAERLTCWSADVQTGCPANVYNGRADLLTCWQDCQLPGNADLLTCWQDNQLSDNTERLTCWQADRMTSSPVMLTCWQADKLSCNADLLTYWQFALATCTLEVPIQGCHPHLQGSPGRGTWVHKRYATAEAVCQGHQTSYSQ
jgi:hypothetical protein